MFNDIRNNPTIEDVKKIFGNKDNALDFIRTYYNLSADNCFIKNSSPYYLYQRILDTWNYDNVKFYTRHISKQKKYSLEHLKTVSKKYEETKKIIEENYDGQKQWAFNIMSYENKLTSTIRNNNDFNTGLEKHLNDTKKNYIIKSYTIYRSFLYEYFLIKHHENLLPTLSNSKSVDFYYNGKNFDLKNASSVTEEFKIEYGQKWMQEALNNPQRVAKFLYMLQNENRFGYNPRIFIVELEGKLKTITGIERDCRDLNFGETHKVDFTYKINGEFEKFTTESLVVFI
jgi:hypothetical protein